MKARLPWLLLALTAALVLAMLFLSLGQEPLFDTLFFGAQALGLALMGAFIASRQPDQRISWLFLGNGLWSAFFEMWEAFAYHDLPTGRVGEWAITWSWLVDLLLYGLVFLVFPTGRLLSVRWRAAVLLLVVGCAFAVPGQAFDPSNVDSESGVNAFASDSVLVPVAKIVGYALLLPGAIASVASLFLRYRSATGIERLQIKQILFAGVIVITTTIVAVPFYRESLVVQAVASVGVLALPVAAGLAILRHGLYDIDLIINRTLVYVPLTALLAGLYVAMSGVLRAVFQEITGAGSEAATAISTLTFVALLTPVKNQLQVLVDRRFKEAPDPARELKRVNEQAQAFVDVANVEALLTRYAATLRNALHARGAEIRLAGSWTRHEGRYADGETVIAPYLTVAIEDGERSYGEVMLSEREDLRPYDTPDEDLVRDSARVIAGVLSLKGQTETREPLPLADSLA